MTTIPRPDAITLDPVKLREAILFLLREGADDRDLGRTKLMKLLFYADFGHYQKHRRAITGAPYHKYPLGPVAPAALDALRDLEREGVITRHLEQRGRYNLSRYRVDPTARTDHLGDDERLMLKLISLRWHETSTSAIVDASHRDAPWRTAPEMGIRIAYDTSILLPY